MVEAPAAEVEVETVAPSVEAPAAPSVEAPVVEAPVVEAPAAEVEVETVAPSVEAPAAPSVEAPVVEAPVVEAPVVETVEAPAAEVEVEATEEEVAEEIEAQEDEPEEAAAEGITVIQDMEVYDHQARMVGSVAQVGVDQSLSPVLLIRSDDGEISVIPWSRISTIGHIILLGDEEVSAAPQAAPEPVAEPEPEPQFQSLSMEIPSPEPVAEPEPEPQKPDGCPACGAANAPDSRFCEACGNNLG